MADGIVSRIRDGLKKMKDDAEERKDFEMKLACYEEYYRESKSRKPELPDLESMADLKKQDPNAYADTLDKLVHMRASIDAAYEAAKKVPNFDPKSSSAGKDYGDAYVQVGMAVHDDWCINNTQKYSDPKRADRQWQFLSSEAIGYDEFVEDLKYVDIVMTKKGYPSFMKNDFVAQDGDTLSAKDHVKSAFAAKQRAYEAKTPEERRAFELNRWVSLSAKKAENARKTDPDYDSDEYTLATLLPHSDEELNYPVYDGELNAGGKYFVGEPYKITDFHSCTYVDKCDAVDKAMGQAEEKRKPDRLKLAESSLGVESKSSPSAELEGATSDLTSL